MSAGKFVGEAAVAAIRAWSPLDPDNIARRRTNKAVRKIMRKTRKGKPLTAAEVEFMSENTTPVQLPGGEIVPRIEPLIPARTSTKIGVGAGVVGAFPAVELLNWVQSLELQPAWLEAATNSDYFVFYGTLVLAWAIARVSKSPSKPGAL